jgi:hypothetical protein
MQVAALEHDLGGGAYGADDDIVAVPARQQSVGAADVAASDGNSGDVGRADRPLVGLSGAAAPADEHEEDRAQCDREHAVSQAPSDHRETDHSAASASPQLPSPDAASNAVPSSRPTSPVSEDAEGGMTFGRGMKALRSQMNAARSQAAASMAATQKKSWRERLGFGGESDDDADADAAPEKPEMEPVPKTRANRSWRLGLCSCLSFEDGAGCGPSAFPLVAWYRDVHAHTHALTQLPSFSSTLFAHSHHCCSCSAASIHLPMPRRDANCAPDGHVGPYTTRVSLVYGA